MAYASRSGRARTSSSQPQAFGVCQRCGIWYQRNELRNQFEWRGAALLPTWVFVCRTCMDVPFEQNRVIILPADPIPVQLALPEDFSVATSVMGLALPQGTVDPITNIPVSPTTGMETVDGILMAPTPTGRPPGYDALITEPVAPKPVLMATVDGTYMTKIDKTAMAEQSVSIPVSGMMDPLPDTEQPPLPNGVPVPIVSLMADGTPLVRATCNGPHGLQLNSQILVRGAGNPLADGAFSVIPITATAFTYGCYSPVPQGSLLEPLTVIVATQIGLPRDFPALPQTGHPQQVLPTKGVQ